MDIRNFSKQDLIKELERRDVVTPSSKSSLVVGTMGMDQGRPFIEVFKKVEKPEDLNWVDSFRLRALLNTHRQYRLFHFKTDIFAELETRLNESPYDFAEWVNETSSINFSGI